jgi:hypothetical protein
VTGFIADFRMPAKGSTSLRVAGPVVLAGRLGRPFSRLRDQALGQTLVKNHTCAVAQAQAR